MVHQIDRAVRLVGNSRPGLHDGIHQGVVVFRYPMRTDKRIDRSRNDFEVPQIFNEMLFDGLGDDVAVPSLPGENKPLVSATVEEESALDFLGGEAVRQHSGGDAGLEVIAGVLAVPEPNVSNFARSDIEERLAGGDAEQLRHQQRGLAGLGGRDGTGDVFPDEVGAVDEATRRDLAGVDPFKGRRDRERKAFLRCRTRTVDFSCCENLGLVQRMQDPGLARLLKKLVEISRPSEGWSCRPPWPDEAHFKLSSQQQIPELF